MVREGMVLQHKLSFDGSAGSLGALSNSGPIQDLIYKQNYSPYNQADDYSYVNNGNFALNPRITAYVNGVLVYGVEPSVGGSPWQRVQAPVESMLHVRVLGNPVVGQTA